MPNQLGLDQFDLADAFGEQKEYLCSKDLREFIQCNHLNLSLSGGLNPRDAFGSHEDSDHVYNTPRAWFMLRYFNPRTKVWDGSTAAYTPCSDDLPWCMVPEKKITPEDVKYALSAHYQGTPFDPYDTHADPLLRGAYRAIGINRNDFMALLQLRPQVPEAYCAVEWLAFASNAFNAMAPFYANVSTTPTYLSQTTQAVSTENFYWVSRLIAALADAAYSRTINHIERYQLAVHAQGHEVLGRYDALLSQEADAARQAALREEANQAVADMVRREAADTLIKVLNEQSNHMKNAFSRSDA